MAENSWREIVRAYNFEALNLTRIVPPQSVLAAAAAAGSARPVRAT